MSHIASDLARSLATETREGKASGRPRSRHPSERHSPFRFPEPASQPRDAEKTEQPDPKTETLKELNE
jgi:hypothetical protein